jgi:hypothetical protein
MWQLEVRACQLRTNSVALLIAGLASTACYNYVPVSLQAVQSKEEVRVRVTDAAAMRLSKELGAIANEIDGQIAREGSDSVSLGVSIDKSYRGTTVGTTTQTLFLGRSEVLEVRKREFSRSRTVLVSAGTVVGFGLLAAGISQLFDANEPSDNSSTPPPPPALRRPAGYHLALRIRFP